MQFQIAPPLGLSCFVFLRGMSPSVVPYASVVYLFTICLRGISAAKVGLVSVLFPAVSQ